MHTLFSVLELVLILGVLIFVHELGHFVVAKLFGIRVDEFGMGFPPRAVKLFSRNGTDYTLNWIPFGGFVKIYGEDSLGKDDPDYKRSLVSKKWWQQILVLIAGVSMNVFLAWILFSTTLMMGAPVTASQTEHPEQLRNAVLTVLEVSPNSPAQSAGVRAGDQILKASMPQTILSNATADAFTEFIRADTLKEPITLELKNVGNNPPVREVIVVPQEGITKGHVAIGVAVDVVGIQDGLSFFPALGQGWGVMTNAVTSTFHSFGQLFGGKISFDSLSGPVGLTRVVGDAARVGLVQVILLAAFISINLAVINILPFPALDGGRILFTLIEAIIRRPLPRKFVEWTNGAGFLLLILLMLIITVKDVIHLF